MAELSELLNSKSPRTKCRHIRDNVEKVTLEISHSNADSTYLATPSDGGGHTELVVDYENVTRVYDTLDAVSEQTPDLSLTGSNEGLFSHNSYIQSPEKKHCQETSSKVSWRLAQKECQRNKDDFVGHFPTCFPYVRTL